MSLPRVTRGDPVRLDVDQVRRLAEAAALRARRVDLLRRRLEIVESVTEVQGYLEWGTPKTHQARSVPLPKTLADRPAPIVATKAPEELVFTAPAGGPLRLRNWRMRVFDSARDRAGLGTVTPHDLRHTAASLAIASGANVKAVQRMLGHASAAMTLDVHAGLFGDDLDAVGVAPDRHVPQMCHNGPLGPSASGSDAAKNRV